MLESDKEVVHVLSSEYVAIHCPACDCDHSVRVSGPHAWTWNKSVYTPTFGPSILVTSGHYAAGFAKTDECWCTYKRDHPEDDLSFNCYRCHSYVENGSIRFLDDCSHELKGQTVPLPPHPNTLEIF